VRGDLHRGAADASGTRLARHMAAAGSSRPRSPAVGAGTRLAITVLGGIGISHGSRDLHLPNRKARALLACLALSETGREQRERLAGLLWGETTEQNARASLRQALFDIREAFASTGCEAISAGRRDVAIDPAMVALDLDAILDGLATGDVPEALLQPRLADTLLAGYDDLSPMLSGWIQVQRRAVQDRLLRALELPAPEVRLSSVP
jgi:DNA-binding SARP family transcriptional activator